MSQNEMANPGQKEIDEQEWSNSQNWHCTFYYSRKDSRTFVPKRRGYGTTVNFASWGTCWFFLMLLSMPAVILASVLLTLGR
jgi:uncharacterized membrane protein